MTLVNNFVVHKIQSKLNMNIYICHYNLIRIQNNVVNYHNKQRIAPGVDFRL